MRKGTKEARSLERFHRRIDKTGDCWLWIGGVNNNGYGRMIFRGKQRTAHSIMYELENGPAPKDGCILRSCGNKLCVMPDHLVLDSRKTHFVRHGPERPNAKLTIDQVIEIRSIDGVRNTEIAKIYGVSDSCIHAIKNHVNWKDV